MMTYEERGRLKDRRVNFNLGASFYNQMVYAKANKDSDALTAIGDKILHSKEEVKETYAKIEKTVANENEQSKLADIFLETSAEVLSKNIAPVETNRYVANRDFYDDALLITFLIDSKADKGPLKAAEQNARTVARYGQGELEDPANDKYWEVELEEQYKALYHLVGV